MRKLVLILILCSLAATAEAGTQEQGMAAGAVVGATAGTVIGARNNEPLQGAVVGAVFGAVLGGILAGQAEAAPAPQEFHQAREYHDDRERERYRYEVREQRHGEARNRCRPQREYMHR